MHLETMRYALYRESIDFLMGNDQAPASRTGPTAHRPVHSKQEGADATDARLEQQKIPGYDFGTTRSRNSPITMAEWEELKKSALFSQEDVVYLRLSEDVLATQVDDLLKTWRGIVFDHPHLRAYDEDPRPTRSIPTMPRPSENVSANGCSTPRGPSTIRPGSTTSTRSGCGTIGRKKNKTDHGHTLGHIRARDLLAFCASIVRADEAVPGQERPLPGSRQPNVRRLVESDDSAGDAVGSALCPRRGFLAN